MQHEYMFISGLSDSSSDEFLVLAAVVVADPAIARGSIDRLRGRLLSDSFRNRLSSVRALEHRRPTYEDDHPTVRNEVLQTLSEVAFEADVCLSSINDTRKRPAEPDGIDAFCFRLAIGGMHATARGHLLRIAFPSQDPSDHERLRQALGNLKSDGSSRFPNIPIVEQIDRNDPIMTIPNYVSGIVRAALQGDLTERRRALQLYESIAHRIRSVTDWANGIVFRQGAFTQELKRRIERN